MKNISIGLDMFHYAIIIDEATETYDAPVHIPGLMQLNAVPATNSAVLKADDKSYEVADSLGDIAVVLGLADIPTVDQAAMLGHSVDANGVLIKKNTDKAPYVAIGYRRKMTNGKYKFFWNYKGKFRPFDQNADTQGDTVTFQTPSILGTFLPRDKDGKWQGAATDGDPGFTQLVADAWFDSVYETVTDVVAPTVTIVPLDSAVSVAADANVVWTFSKSIRPNLITSANFMLLDASLAPVAGILDYNSDSKIITFNPTATLTAGAEYTAIATVGVKDLAGNALAAPSITTFTVAV